MIYVFLRVFTASINFKSRIFLKLQHALKLESEYLFRYVCKFYIILRMWKQNPDELKCHIEEANILYLTLNHRDSCTLHTFE